MRPALAYLAGELESLEREGRLRTWRRAAHQGAALDACSNDYLGYGSEVRLDGLVGPTGARGSRLVIGDDPGVRRLEDEVAQWVGHEAALVFTSGYAANVGAVSALAGKGDLIVSDERNHASLIDGCRLSRATVRVVAHGDLAAVRKVLEEGAFERRWVVVESVYSMDGTVSDVAGLREECDRVGAGLVVDEAHALGVIGRRGAGVCAREGVQADVLTGAFGKAIGVQGGFVASDSVAAHWMWNRARTLVFSTGMSPLLAHVVRRNVQRASADDEGRARLTRHSAALRQHLADGRVPVLAGSTGPIIPVMLRENAACVRAEQQLLERAVRAKAIRPPTVAEGAARLRITVKASMTLRDVERLGEALVACCR